MKKFFMVTVLMFYLCNPLFSFANMPKEQGNPIQNKENNQSTKKNKRNDINEKTRYLLINESLTKINYYRNQELDSFTVLRIVKGIAIIGESEQIISGFFSYEALEKIWRQKCLILKMPIYAVGHPITGLPNGLFYAFWNKKTNQGQAYPIIHDFLSNKLIDENNEKWTIAIFILSENPGLLINTFGENND